jgi:uncharacterized protein
MMVGFNSAQSGAARVSDAVIGNSAQSLASATIAQNSRLGRTDIAGINAAIDKLAATDPAAANALRNEIAGSLSPVEQGQLAANYGGLSQGGNLIAANPGGAARGLSKAEVNIIRDIGQIGLDIAGIFDPTPISDGLSTIISLGKGDWFGAAISAGGAIFPYVGDAAKLGKLGKWAKTISDAVDMAATNPAFRRAVEPALRKMSDAIGAIGVDRLPANVRGQFATIKRNADAVLQRFDVTVRGTKITLENVTTQTVNYVKRDRTQYSALRKAFDGANGARAQFAKQIATNPTQVAALKRAGLDDAQIARLAEGKIPQGWQVHHKLPLDDGGTNAPSNLVLIKNDPYHIGITNAQRTLVGDLTVGSSRQVDFPVPNGVVYPP